MEQQSQNSLNFSANDEDRERDNNGNTSLGGGPSGAGGLLALSVGGLSDGSPVGKHSAQLSVFVRSLTVAEIPEYFACLEGHLFLLMHLTATIFMSALLQASYTTQVVPSPLD